MQYFDVSIFVENHNALLLTDIHIGIEESLEKSGVLLPLDTFDKLIIRTEKILKHYKKKYNKIIILGDLKHEFGKISDTEWSHTLKYIDLLAPHTKEIILLKGNHDKILEPILKKRNLSVKHFEILGENLLLHGDILPEQLIKQKLLIKQEMKQIETIIIGHEHPAISLVQGVRTETYKCFVLGKYKKFNLIVMPSLNLISYGTDILKESMLSPFLKQKLTDFEIKIVDEFNGEVMEFGKIKNIN